jgi:acetyl-CoA acyltransferase
VTRDAVILTALRTPVGKRNGAYKDVHPVDLSARVLNAVIEHASLAPDLVDDVIWGVVGQVGEQSLNLARNAVLAAGWPEAVPGTTVDRQCGSSQQALHFAAASVISGQHDLVIAGGVEVMTRVPMGEAVGGDVTLAFGRAMTRRYAGQEINQGLGAEMIAEKWGFSRARLDEFSVDSHRKAAAAIDSGAFAAQYALIKETGLTTDEGVRRDTTVAKMSALKPAFKDDGHIHAGNSSQISDGAAALIVTTSDKARELGRKPIARLHAFAVAGADPVMMLTAPMPATAKVLARAGMPLDDIGVYEINEAFASVPLAWLAETGADSARLNPLGGAIAIGHPLGASGAILMTRLVHHMADNGISYGLQSMCEGGGMANATIVELL